MVWTYSGNPADSARDEVRFLIGDTDSNQQQLQDAEIDYLVGLHPRQVGYANYRASAAAASTIAGKYANAINKSVGSLSISLSSKREQWNELATKLADMASKGSGVVIGPPILGGGGPTYLANWEFWDDHSP